MEERMLFLVVIALLVFTGFSVYNNRQGDVSGFQVKQPSISDVSDVLKGNQIVIVDTGINPNTYYSLDSPSTELGADGYPSIVYTRRLVNGGTQPFEIVLAKCRDQTCNPNKNSYSVFDKQSVSIGNDNSIAIPSDGLPFIIYIYTDPNIPSSMGGLKAIKCGTPDCTLGNIFTILEPAVPGPNGPNIGAGNSITIGTDGLPIMSYTQFQFTGESQIRILKCNNPVCTSNEINIVDSYPSNGFYLNGPTSITISSDGLPIIAFARYDITNMNGFDLAVIKCGDIDCTSGNTFNIVDSINGVTVGNYNSITVGSDGLPIISYLSGPNLYELRVLKCKDQYCTPSSNIISVIDNSASGMIGETKIKIGQDGLPIISYYKYDSTVPTTHRKTIKCGNLECNSGNVGSIIDSSIGIVEKGDMTIGGDNKPFLPYPDVIVAGNNLYKFAIKGAKCGTASCKSR